MSMTSGGSLLGKSVMDLRQPHVVNGLLISSRTRLLREYSRDKIFNEYRMPRVLMPRIRYIVEMLFDKGVWNRMLYIASALGLYHQYAMGSGWSWAGIQ
jgi:hypothetical protein